MNQFDRNDIEKFAKIGEEAFWYAIAMQFPNITTGDLNPYSATLFSLECERVVKEWIDTNGVTEEDLPEYVECPNCLVEHTSLQWEGLCDYCFNKLNAEKKGA